MRRISASGVEGSRRGHLGIAGPIGAGHGSRPGYTQLFRLEQRCGRCGCASLVEVEGASQEQRSARRNAVLESTLAACVACGRRGLFALPLSALLSLPLAVVAGVGAASLALFFTAAPDPVFWAGLGGGSAALAFAAGLRLGRADGRVRGFSARGS